MTVLAALFSEIATAGADGAWSMTLNLSPREDAGYAITATQEDLAGNVSEASSPVTVRIPPIDAPVLSQDSDLGASPFDRLTSDTTPTLTGVLPAEIRPETEIVIFVNGTRVASGSASEATGGLVIDYDNSFWRYTPADDLESGEYDIVVSIGGIPSAPLTVTVDADPPAAPLIRTPFNGLALHNDNGEGIDGAEIVHAVGAAATIAGWVYIGDSNGVTTSGSEAQTIFGADGDMEVTISTGGAVMLGAGGASIDTGFAASQGWHYIAGDAGRGGPVVLFQ